MKYLTALLFPLLFILSGCFNPSLEKVCYICGDTGACPDGAECTAGLCTGASACEKPCGRTIAGAAAGNFSIGFDIATRANEQSTLLYQRATCDANNDFWNILMSKTGQLTMEIAKPYATLTSSGTVNDGAKHTVYARRINGVLTLYIDNKDSDSIAAPQNLDTLPQLGVMSGHPCEAAGLKPLAGAVSNVCLWGKQQ